MACSISCGWAIREYWDAMNRGEHPMSGAQRSALSGCSAFRGQAVLFYALTNPLSYSKAFLLSLITGREGRKKKRAFLFSQGLSVFMFAAKCQI